MRYSLRFSYRLGESAGLASLELMCIATMLVTRGSVQVRAAPLVCSPEISLGSAVHKVIGVRWLIASFEYCY